MDLEKLARARAMAAAQKAVREKRDPVKALEERVAKAEAEIQSVVNLGESNG